MDLKTKFKRSAICVGVRFVRSARPGSFSIEIVESKFLKLGYLRSESTADQPQSGPVREQHLIVGIIMKIEMHQ